jgi:carboxypeptidase PM20D1
MNLLFFASGLGLVVLFAGMLYRTLRFSARPGPVPPAAAIAVDNDQAAGRLALALRFRTVSQEDPDQFAGDVFQAFQAWLAETFPRVHASLQKGTVGGFGLLFTWPGSETALRPVLLMAHQDVVPVNPETEPDWTHPPFAGEIAEGHVWGRGALDDKSSLMGILEAVEALLAAGFQPRRTLYLAFGQDEEIGGTQGAARIAGLLRSRQVRLEYILDEGGFVAKGLIPGVAAPVALVGIAEKGYLTLELSVAGEGGHSSMPERQTTIGILSRRWFGWKRTLPVDLSFSRLFFAKVGSGIASANGSPGQPVALCSWVEDAAPIRRDERRHPYHRRTHPAQCGNEGERPAGPGHGGGEFSGPAGREDGRGDRAGAASRSRLPGADPGQGDPQRAVASFGCPCRQLRHAGADDPPGRGGR